MNALIRLYILNKYHISLWQDIQNHAFFRVGQNDS